ncbi:MAG: 16S rRNA (cytosine(1402)-N(4))-methyltransferase RsmH [Deltaproteobacteria bacterium]|nr:16S rRNA (cytosine(1402)-N(4))-methyltransferase RsmH [Deltaproteobacteria bacterium]
MPAQVVDLLQVVPGGRYVDLTVGAGGHARLILERSGPDGRVLGVDRDPEALALARERLAGAGERLLLVHGRFSDLPELMARAGWKTADGLLADLGVSSMQLERPERGFSFQRPGPLDMRMDRTGGRPLSRLLDEIDAPTLAERLAELGELGGARGLARAILEARRQGRLTDTVRLAELVSARVRAGRRTRTHPATRVFLALRLLVNAELDELEALLSRLPEPLAAGGRAVIISFHSLEDRLVKQRFAELEGSCRCPPGLPACRCGARVQMRRLTRRAMRPDRAELETNPRARSARLRAAERVCA